MLPQAYDGGGVTGSDERHFQSAANFEFLPLAGIASEIGEGKHVGGCATGRISPLLKEK